MVATAYVAELGRYRRYRSSGEMRTAGSAFFSITTRLLPLDRSIL